MLIEQGLALLTALLGSDLPSQAQVSIHQINIRKALFKDAFGNRTYHLSGFFSSPLESPSRNSKLLLLWP